MTKIYRNHFGRDLTSCARLSQRYDRIGTNVICVFYCNIGSARKFHRQSQLLYFKIPDCAGYARYHIHCYVFLFPTKRFKACQKYFFHLSSPDKSIASAFANAMKSYSAASSFFSSEFSRSAMGSSAFAVSSAFASSASSLASFLWLILSLRAFI